MFTKLAKLVQILFAPREEKRADILEIYHLGMVYLFRIFALRSIILALLTEMCTVFSLPHAQIFANSTNLH